MVQRPLGRSFAFAEPIKVNSIADCHFYHSVDIPGHGTVEGEWDLRPGIDAYLGGYAFAGKRVLDVGTASGFLTYAAERKGAEVVSYDLSVNDSWDVVPHGGRPDPGLDAAMRSHIGRINNGYWLCHQAFGSKARLVHGTVYDIPADIGPVDATIFGSILLHLRDPLRALELGARLATDAVIVTDVAPFGRLGALLMRPQYLPHASRPQSWDAWWKLPPRLVRRHLAVLGFPHAVTTWHTQFYKGQRRSLYTVVARRA